MPTMSVPSMYVLAFFGIGHSKFVQKQGGVPLNSYRTSGRILRVVVLPSGYATQSRSHLDGVLQRRWHPGIAKVLPQTRHLGRVPTPDHARNVDRISLSRELRRQRGSLVRIVHVA